MFKVSVFPCLIRVAGCLRTFVKELASMETGQQRRENILGRLSAAIVNILGKILVRLLHLDIAASEVLLGTCESCSLFSMRNGRESSLAVVASRRWRGERCYLIFVCSRYKRAHATRSYGA